VYEYFVNSGELFVFQSYLRIYLNVAQAFLPVECAIIESCFIKFNLIKTYWPKCWDAFRLVQTRAKKRSWLEPDPL